MLSLKYVRENLENVMAALKDRQMTLDLSGFRECEAERRRLLTSVEALRRERNAASAEVAALKKTGGDAAAIIAGMKDVGGRIKGLEEEVKACETRLEEMLLYLPNIPHASVPRGCSEADNPVVRSWGEPRKFSFPVKPHWELGEKLGILDFNRASKIAGARFSLSLGAGARLERAIINFMLDLHTVRHGYLEVLPPFLVNRDSLIGTGQLPKFENELFRTSGDDYYLIPTAEVPVTNIHRDEILAAETLPIRYVAYTPCFRREAGSYGKDTRGLIRQHQFNKVELVKFTRPEDSYQELEKLVADAEEVLRQLGIPYRVSALCTADLGFSAAKTYDLEAWMPGQGAYREISSCSNFEDYQARRAGIRYRPESGARPEYVHTLNGSGLAVGRTLVAILENFQEEDGSVTIPEVLASYMGGTARIVPPGK